jgi:hypothetical protein
VSEGKPEPADIEGAPGAASPARRRWSGAKKLDLGLILIAASWMAILANQANPRFERWLAAIVLFLVGATGLLGIGTRRGTKGGAAP